MVAAGSFMLLSGCRPDLGRPRYPDLPAWSDTSDPFLAGPYPYEVGDERLGVGLFYEGPTSETVPIDDTVTHYYVYASTYSQQASAARVEGLESALIVLGSVGWWGGGVTWDSPRDLSAWTTYHLSFRATDPVFDAFEVGVTGGAEARLPASAYGFVADGEWHSLVIPLADFAASGADLTQVGIPLMLISDVAVEGAALNVDDVFLTKE